jgi:sugar phosphate isomerase/epimerase
MSGLSRRSLLRSAAGAVGGAALATHAHATDPIKRTGKPSLKLSVAAYSYRDHLTGKAAPNMVLTDFVRLAAETGWDAVELTSYYFPTEITPAYLAQLKRQCYLLGLDISGTSVRNEFTYPPGPQREREIEHVKRWLEFSAALGAPAMRIFAGAAKPGQSLEQAQKCCMECIEACSETAARCGVILGLENHGGITASSEGILGVVRGVRSEWCGINLDTGNFRTTDPYADMTKCAPYATTAHVKTEIQPAGRPKEAADLSRIASIFRARAYRGYLTLEYEAAQPALGAVPAAHARLRKAIEG